MNPRYAAALITAFIGMMAMCYLIYLAASWNEYQQDRARRDEKINELLDRIPPPKREPTVIVDAS